MNDWCVKDGTATPDMSVSMTDGGAIPDMTTPKPCQDGFPLGTQGVWACRGAFSPASPRPPLFAKMATRSVAMATRSQMRSAQTLLSRAFSFPPCRVRVRPGSSHAACQRRQAQEQAGYGSDAAGIKARLDSQPSGPTFLARTFLWLPIALCKIYSSATKEICDWTRSGWTIHEAESSVALRRAFLSDS